MFEDNPPKESYDSLIDSPNVTTTPEGFPGDNNDFILDVTTYILILELAHIDMERKCAKVWVELGFRYDVHDYLRTFDSFVGDREKMKLTREERLKTIAPEDMQIPFDIVNALEMEMRSEAHFIRKTDGKPLDSFYMESPEFNKDKSAKFLSTAKNMVNFVDLEECERGKYWKHETRAYSMELSFCSTEQLAPFDEIHLFFKLITANCQPGTNRIRFIYDKEESDFSGFKHSIQGYHPISPDPHIHSGHSYSNAAITWDRLYISFPFQKKKSEDIIKYYIVPFLSYYYMVIAPIQEVEELLAISSTLVIANVALLLTAGNYVFTLYEQAILIQIVVLVVSTLILAYFTDSPWNIQFVLALFNAGVFVFTLCIHWIIANNTNNRIRSLIKAGKYSELKTI